MTPLQERQEKERLIIIQEIIEESETNNVFTILALAKSLKMVTEAPEAYFSQTDLEDKE